MARREKLSRACGLLDAAHYRLAEAADPSFAQQFVPHIHIELVTKRFEYTFESLWKALRELLLEQGITANSPLQCFKDAFAQGWIAESDEAIFPAMVRARNIIVHLYSDDDATEIYQDILQRFLPAITRVVEQVRILLT